MYKKSRHTPLQMCPECNEKSVIRRFYQRKYDNKQERFEFCLNKFCGYKMALPFYDRSKETIC